jgi:hypothetical protein
MTAATEMLNEALVRVQRRGPRMLHFNSRERTALHEAAHVVAVKAYGFPIDFAEVCVSTSEAALGRVVWRSSSTAHWASTVVSLAGAQGELAFCNNESGSDRDFECAEQAAREVDAENSDEVMQLAQVAAMKIVRDNRTLISALAVILEHKDRLSDAEINGIIGSIGKVRSGPVTPDMTPLARARRDAARRRARRDYEGAVFIEKWIRQQEGTR